MTGNATSPVLEWPGKRPPASGRLEPSQLVEWFHPALRNPAGAVSDGNALIWGDNLDVLTYLLANGARGKVKLIYIDPPFDTGLEHRRKVRLRMPKAARHADQCRLGCRRPNPVRRPLGRRRLSPVHL